MSLTKKDIDRISSLFNLGFKELILPTLNNMEDRLRSVDNDLKSLRKDYGINVQKNTDEHEEIISNIGFYFGKCASKEDLQSVEKRVSVLEVKCA